MTEVELTSKQQAKIKRAIKALNDVRKEIELENKESDIGWYLEGSGSLHLTNGETHDWKNEAEPLQESILASFELDKSGGGGW